MSDTEKTTETDSEVGYLDIYLRFNDDMEKDYCFQVKTTTVLKIYTKFLEHYPFHYDQVYFIMPNLLGSRNQSLLGT